MACPLPSVTTTSITKRVLHPHFGHLRCLIRCCTLPLLLISTLNLPTIYTLPQSWGLLCGRRGLPFELHRYPLLLHNSLAIPLTPVMFSHLFSMYGTGYYHQISPRVFLVLRYCWFCFTFLWYGIENLSVAFCFLCKCPRDANAAYGELRCLETVVGISQLSIAWPMLSEATLEVRCGRPHS